MQKLIFSLILCLFVSVSFAGQASDSDTLLKRGNLPPDDLVECRYVINLGGISFTVISLSCEGARSAINLAQAAYRLLKESFLLLFSPDDTSVIL